MLRRVHCPGVNVKIRINFDGCHPKTAGLKNFGDRRHRHAFAHAGHYPSDYKNIFHKFLRSTNFYEYTNSYIRIDWYFVIFLY